MAAKTSTSRRRIKDAFFESNKDKVHKGFTFKTKTALCAKCKKSSRHSSRTFVLKDGTVQGTITCLHCFNQNTVKHDTATCQCAGCEYVKATPKAVSKGKIQLTDVKTLMEIYDKVRNKTELTVEEAKTYKEQFKSDLDALLAFIEVLKNA